MATDNDIEVVLKASVDPSVARAWQQFVNDVKKNSGEAKRVLDDWSNYAKSVAVQIANTERLVSKDQVNLFKEVQKTKTQLEKQLTSGIQAEMKTRVKAWSDAEKESLRSIKIGQDEALRTIQKSEKSATAAVIAENKARIKSYQDAENLRVKFFQQSQKQSLAGTGILTGTPAPIPGGGSNSNGMSSWLTAGLTGLATRFAPYYAAYKTARATLNFEKEGISTADSIRDADAAIRAYSKDAKEAQSSIDFFNNAQSRARQTSLDLKKIFTTIKPKADTYGLGPDTTRNLAVELGNISAFRKDSPEVEANSLANVIGGRIIGSNPLMKALGITIEQVKEWKKNGDDVVQHFIQKIHEVNAEAIKQGDTFASIWEKVRFSMLSNFAEGWNQARGNAMKGMDDIKKMVNDPEFKANLRSIGRGSALIVEIVSVGIQNSLDAIRNYIDIVGTAIRALLTVPLTMISRMLSSLSVTLNALHIPSTAVDQADKLVKTLSGSNAKQINENISDLIARQPAALKRNLELFKDIKKFFNDEYIPSKQFKGAGIVEVNDEDRSTDPKEDPKENARIKAIKNAREHVKEVIDDLKSKVKELNVERKYVLQGVDGYTGTALSAWTDLNKQIADINKDAEILVIGLSKSLEKVSDPSLTTALNNAVENWKAARKALSSQTALDKSIGSLFDKDKGWNFHDALGFNDKGVSDAVDAMKLADSESKTIQNSINRENKKSQADIAREYAKQLKQATKDIKLFEGMADDFIIGLTRGGKEFSRAMANSFTSAMKDGSQDLIKMVVSLITGVSEDTGADGKTVFKGRDGKVIQGASTIEEATAKVDGGKNSVDTIKTVMSLAQIALGAYTNARANPKGSITQGVIGGGLAGISGGPYMAIIGAVVGGIAAAIGKSAAQDKYKFAHFTIDKTGLASADSSSVQEITKDKLKAMTAQVQQTFDDIWNGMVRLMLQIHAVIPKLNAIDGNFQDNPSGHYLEHFDDWVNNRLPQNIINTFQGGLGKAAEGMGMSIARFNQIWTRISLLDPKKQIEVWGNLFTALQNFQDVMNFIRGSVSGTSSPVSGHRHAITGGSASWQAFRRDEESNIIHPTFLKDTEDARNKMLDLAKAIGSLTGDSQISAAKDLSNLMVDYMTTAKAYMKDLVMLSHQIQDDVDSMIRDLTAQGMTKKDDNGNTIPDYEKQTMYYKHHADEILLNLNNATNPEDVKKFWTEYVDTLNKIQSLQSQLGPENAEEVRKWVIEALEIGNTYFQDSIKKLGESVNSVNNWINENLGPYITQFRTLLGDVGDGLDDIGKPGGPIDNLPDPINRAGEAFNNVVGKIVAFGTALDDLTNRINNFNPDGTVGTGSVASYDPNEYKNFVYRVKQGA